MLVSHGGRQLHRPGDHRRTRPRRESERTGPGISRTAADQRARMVAAMRELAATERGWRPVTVAQVIAHAGVSRKTFYEHFENGEDLFGTVVEAAFDEVCAALDAAAAFGGVWEERVVAVVRAFFDALAADQHTAWLCAVESLGNDERARAARRAANERIEKLIAPPANVARGVPAATADGVVRMLWELAYQQLTGADQRPLADLVQPGAFLALSPYVEPAVAMRYARGGAGA